LSHSWSSPNNQLFASSQWLCTILLGYWKCSKTDF
jgi:hypothetical protein